MSDVKNGGQRLANWIEKTGRTHKWVREQIGVQDSRTLQRYIKTNRCPKAVALVLENLCGAWVPADTWEWK